MRIEMFFSKAFNWLFFGAPSLQHYAVVDVCNNILDSGMLMALFWE